MHCREEPVSSQLRDADIKPTLRHTECYFELKGLETGCEV